MVPSTTVPTSTSWSGSMPTRVTKYTDRNVNSRLRISPSAAACRAGGRGGRLERADRARTADAQHQALEHAEAMIQVAAFQVGHGQVDADGEVQILGAAIDQQRRRLGQHRRWIDTAPGELF